MDALKPDASASSTVSHDNTTPAAAVTATSQNSNTNLDKNKSELVAVTPPLDSSFLSTTISSLAISSQSVPYSSSSTPHPPSCVDTKKGFQPSPPSNPEPQLLTLKPVCYQPKEFNSFNQHASPSTPAADFDILSPNTTTTSASTMIFTELYRSRKASLAKTKSNQSTATGSNHSAGPEFDPDLLSRDKSKQREAIRRHLEEHVKSDWDFPWVRTDVPALPIVVRQTVVDGVATEVRYHDPAAQQAATIPLSEILKNQQLCELEPVEAFDTGAEPDSASEDEAADDDNESVYSVMTEDETQYKPRLEWDSEFMATDSGQSGNRSASDSRDSVVMSKELRRKAVKAEMKWNQGLACFEARRNKWTCAKVARLRPKAVTATPQPPPLSPLSPRRLFFRNSIQPSSPPASMLSNATGSDSDAVHATSATLAASTTSASATTGGTSLSSRSCRTDTDSNMYPIETLLPIVSPLLPPENPMRASISPKLYLAIYDRTIVHSMTPSCPINLSDMLPACVAGWKRDGEWPPRAAAPEPSMIRSGRVSAVPSSKRRSLGFLNREDPPQKGFRRGIQKVFGLGGVEQ